MNVRPRRAGKTAEVERFVNKPLAAPGLTSYRYHYGLHACNYIMIGAKDHDDALNEARRSINESRHTVSLDNLEVWNGSNYEKVK